MLETSFSLSPSYSFLKSLYHKSLFLKPHLSKFQPKQQSHRFALRGVKKRDWLIKIRRDEGPEVTDRNGGDCFFAKRQPRFRSRGRREPQWGTANAEIKVPSVENTELKGSPFKAWSRSVLPRMVRLLPGIPSLLISPFRSIHLHFFPKPVLSFSCFGCD